MGRREEKDPKQVTALRECGQWRGTSEFRVGVRGLPDALAAYLNQKQSPTLSPGTEPRGTEPRGGQPPRSTRPGTTCRRQGQGQWSVRLAMGRTVAIGQWTEKDQTRIFHSGKDRFERGPPALPPLGSVDERMGHKLIQAVRGFQHRPGRAQSAGRRE
jgi:hypothetical protein